MLKCRRCMRKLSLRVGKKQTSDSFAPPAAVMSVLCQPFRQTVSTQPALKSSANKRSRSRSVSNDNVAGPSKTIATTTMTAGADDTSSNLLFKGLKFKAQGEARCANVRTEIEGCGGQMVSPGEEATRDEDVDFIIVRLVRHVFLFSQFFVSSHIEFLSSVAANYTETNPMNWNAQSTELNVG